MRPRLFLLSAAVPCAAFHVAGVLTARPVWRYAEVLSIGLLLACAVVNRSPSSPWALGAALAVLFIDAVRTMPAAGDSDGYGWKVLVPGSGRETPSAFESGLALCWPSLVAALVLLVAWRRSGWYRQSVAPAVVAAALISGYAGVRIVSTWRAVAAAPPKVAGAEGADLTMAVGMAVLPPLVLGITALALASVLAGHGRRLASIGATLLALMALPLIDTSIDTIPMPLSVGSANALFAWGGITPTLSMPQPMLALTAVFELTAYLLLVAGLTDSPDPTGASPAEA
ncbi:hypothetical protein DKT68_13345 [Micromonospora acroterricola]|uniref:Uncharacterized protein n=1 Tax=Micromonospora acroterricola TaxID=2202421 RepID=A0A317D8V7_9ACTN|nr:hypothetical protein [Micromonospora acroterricola]PWR09065.1 hypothetical protein DKT68_13345 [Micromonospora acroterricola]